MFLRLRQICLVAEELEPVVDDLLAVFGVMVCHRDPDVAMFGLHNALLPFGTSFVEVVAPMKDDTAAGRYLKRRRGNGGYMVILDTDELPRWRHHVAEIGVRIAAPLSLGDYEGMQLHPRDTGGALLELNTTKGGADLHGPYWPAGPVWQKSVRLGRVSAIVGAELQSDDPGKLAQRWAQILQQPCRRQGDEWRLSVDNAVLRFVAATDGRGEGLAGIDVQVADLQAVLDTAAAHGCRGNADSVQIGGVHFQLQTAVAARE